jgi:tRNA pseudouridine65 synthase
MFQEQLGIHRLLLAATELEFTHPYTQAPLRLSAPLESGFDQLLANFGWRDKIPTRWQSAHPSTTTSQA